MALSHAPHSCHNVIEDYSDEQVGILVCELMNSELPIRRLDQVQAIINAHEDLQPTLQTMVHTNHQLERINSSSRANLDTIVDSVDSTRSLSRICQSLQNERLSHEAVEVIHNEGQNILTNLVNIYSRAASEIRQNTLVLQEAIAENEATRDDPLTNELLQQQIQIITNISNDPRQSNLQIRQAEAIGNQLECQIEKLEPNTNATVRTAAQRNSRHLKYAVGIFFLGAGAIAMCAGIVYLAPIVTALLPVTSAVAGGEALGLLPVVIAVAKTRLS